MPIRLATARLTRAVVSQRMVYLDLGREDFTDLRYSDDCPETPSSHAEYPVRASIGTECVDCPG